MAAHGPFDFVICTHVLEDIRDPVFVMRQLRRVARAGFIAMPHEHFEVTNNESRFLTGCSHRRWICTIPTA
jgi:2-polyprenyl-3-methyl-5-hydroxy-6-metoxy-1,4-benzoquinol methylase